MFAISTLSGLPLLLPRKRHSVGESLPKCQPTIPSIPNILDFLDSYHGILHPSQCPLVIINSNTMLMKGPSYHWYTNKREQDRRQIRKPHISQKESASWTMISDPNVNLTTSTDGSLVSMTLRAPTNELYFASRTMFQRRQKLIALRTRRPGLLPPHCMHPPVSQMATHGQTSPTRSLPKGCMLLLEHGSTTTGQRR
jgi:hypothetical protein